MNGNSVEMIMADEGSYVPEFEAENYRRTSRRRLGSNLGAIPNIFAAPSATSLVNSVKSPIGFTETVYAAPGGGVSFGSNPGGYSMPAPQLPPLVAVRNPVTGVVTTGHSTRDLVSSKIDAGLDLFSKFLNYKVASGDQKLASQGVASASYPTTYAAAGSAINPATGQPYSAQGVGGTIGAGVGGFIDGIKNFVSQNTGLTFLIVGGVVLLMMRPPGRRGR